MLTLVFALQGIELTQPLIPLGFQRIGYQPVVGIDFHVAAPGELGLVAAALQLRLSQGGGLLDALRDLVLHGQSHFDSRRRHRLQQQCADRGIDVGAPHPLAYLVLGAPHRALVAGARWSAA